MTALGFSFDPASVAAPSCIDELARYEQWIIWRLQFVKGRWTKPPHSPKTGWTAAATNPQNFVSYDDALIACDRFKADGVGFSLTRQDPFIGIDLDHCRNAETGEIDDWARAILKMAETYAEVSPSGTGIRMIARGDLDAAIVHKPANVEVYAFGRYVTITGQHIAGTPEDIRPAPMTIDALRARVAAHKPAQEPAETYRPSAIAYEAQAPSSGSGDGFFRNVNTEALGSIGSWVTALFPRARFQSGTGAWRVSSKDLGRNLQEDLSIAPNGIVDFGVHDMGDASDGKRTAIDLVMKYGEATSAREAAQWLCDRLGVTPESLGARQEWDGITRDPRPRAELHEAESPAIDLLAGFTFDGEGSLEPPPMLVKRLVPLDGICFVGGQSGAGKTFLAIDLAVSLASGEPFFGYKVKERVGVAIFAPEGASTIPLRLHVARNEKAQGEILPIAWLGAVPNLRNRRELPGVIASLKALDARLHETHGVRLGAVILDTLAASFDLDDEDDNSEAAKTIRVMKSIGEAVGAVVIPVHHYGKGQETGLRGASGWRAGCDAVLSVLADRNQITGRVSNRSLALAKSRVGEEGAIAPFELRFVKVDVDEDGDDYGACVVEPMQPDAAHDGGAAKTKMSRAARALMSAFQIAVLDKGERAWPFGAEGHEVKAVDREDVRAEFYRSWPADGDTEAKKTAARQKAFKRGESELIERRTICAYEVGAKTLVWVVREDHPAPRTDPDIDSPL